MPIQNEYTDLQEEFLEFCKKHTKTDEQMEKLMKYVIFYVGVFFSRPVPVLRKKLREKIVKGTKTYGSPVYEAYRLRKELEDECIDLIGWTLVHRWNQERRKKKS
jgi:hypothetical protein